ncbi:MAG: rhomboid family intramembrane serine protease [Candidatus Acidiferrum sp.]
MALSYEWQRRLERWKSTVRGLFGFGGDGGQRQPRPQICPACGSLVGISATHCHVCGTSLRFSVAAFSKRFSGVFGEHVAPVTTALLIANFLMLGVSWLSYAAVGEGGGLRILWGLSGIQQIRLGMSIPLPYLVATHEWWRLVTAQFLHGGLIHIGFNMMVLMQIGPAVEEVYGSARYLFLYIVTGAFGYVLSAAAGHFSLGASAGLLGLVGLMLALTTKRGGSQMRELRSRIITSLVILFALGFTGFMAMDNWAHGGGLAAGFVLGKLFADRQPATANERRRAYALGWLAGLAIVASFVLMIMHYRDPLGGESSQSHPATGESALIYCQYKTPAVDPHSIVVVSLHSPKEKVWGELLDINPSGVTLRGIDLNSFDHFVRQINEPDGERIGLPTIFFPMNRLERVSLDEPTGAIPSMNELFARKIGRTLTDYLSQFA